jgi:hypothetical protein
VNITYAYTITLLAITAVRLGRIFVTGLAYLD